MEKSITILSDTIGSGFEAANEKIVRFLKFHGVNNEIAKKQIWITRKLLQICVHYTGAQKTQTALTVQIDVKSGKLTVEVSNPIKGNRNRKLEELDRLVQYIRSYQDPCEALQKLNGDAYNGATLARIAQQYNTAVDFFVSEDNTMKISAVISSDRLFGEPSNLNKAHAKGDLIIGQS